jgi:diguanylate cyclase (GGDEF)-like protein
MSDLLLREDAQRGHPEAVSIEDAILLLGEIERLQAKLERCEARIVELNHLAHWDPLVDLANRRSFFATLERTLARNSRNGAQSAILFVDVDGLKMINDQFGHDVGDGALTEIASLLAFSVRKGDLVARLAGDEFGILLEETDELAAWQTALRIVETVDESRYFVRGICVPLSVAIGVAMIRADDTPESVLTRADREMYRIKAIGPLVPNSGLR